MNCAIDDGPRGRGPSRRHEMVFNPGRVGGLADREHKANKRLSQWDFEELRI